MLLFFPSQTYYSPAGALRRASTSQAKGSSGVGGRLLRTLLLAGAGGTCAVVALEKVPGLQDAIEQVAPGFKDKYSHARLATIGWYERNFQRASQSIDSFTKGAKGVEKSSPSEPPSPPPKVPKPKETPAANAATVKDDTRMEVQASKVPEVTSSVVAEKQQPTVTEAGSQSATHKASEGIKSKSKQKEKVVPARKEEHVKEEHVLSEAKPAEEPKDVSETERDTKLSPKLESPSEPIKDTGAEEKGIAAREQRKEVEDALANALKGFTTAAEVATVSHQQTYAQSLGSALSSMEDVGASSVAQLAAKEQAALAENKYADALKEYKMQKSILEEAIVSAKEFSLDQAAEAEKKLKVIDSSICALEHAMDSARASVKERAVAHPEPAPPGIPPPSSVSPQATELAQLQGMLDASQGESQALTEKVRKLEAQLETALHVQSAEVSLLVEAKVAEEMEKETRAHKAEMEKQVSVLLLQ